MKARIKYYCHNQAIGLNIKLGEEVLEMKYKSTDSMVLILAMDNYFYVCFFTREPESQFAPHLETRPTIFIMSMVLCAGTLDDCCFEYEEISGSNRPLFEGAYVCRHAVIIHRVNSYTTLPSGPFVRHFCIPRGFPCKYPLFCS